MGNGVDEPLLAGRRTLFDERRVAAEEVHARIAGGAVERLGNHRGIAFATGRDEGNRCDGDALIDNRNAQLRLDTLADLHEASGLPGYAVIHRLCGGFHFRARALEQGNSHSDRPDIQTVLLNHVNGVEELRLREVEIHPGRAL